MKFPRSKNPTAEMPFLDHLEELRWRILWSLLALIVLGMLSFFVVMQFDVIGLLKAPIDPYLQDHGGKLIFLGVTEPFFVSLKLAVAMGIVLASPVIFYQVWAFLSPALNKREKRAIVPALYLGLVLFVAGAALAYFVALPFTLRFMLTFQAESLEPQITAGLYFSFVTKLMLGFGAMFEMPVVTMVLTAVGLTSSKFLASKRRYAIAGMAILASMITPGDAITATVVLMGPLLLLYEFSILLAKLVERGQLLSSSSDGEALPAGSD
jgi:sec-independent protein translocase protein TatC